MVSENEFYLVNKNPYRGSRYANFVGAGIDPQGNVSYATNENASNQLGTSVDTSEVENIPGASLETGSVSEGLVNRPGAESGIGSESGALEVPGFAQAAKDLVIGSAIPFAGKTIGQTAGAAFAGGSSFGSALSQGTTALGQKISGGLIGGSVGSAASSAATNAALSGLGSKFGPATASQVAKAAGNTSGSLGAGAIGGAAGAGIGTAIATLATGGSVKDAAKAGVGSAVGTAIGTAIGGPIGGFIGGTIGSIFCFEAGTPILMDDGTTKPVEELQLHDEVLYGGTVIGRGEVYSDDIYRYKNTVVTGRHAVFENGVWVRVQDSELAEKADDIDITLIYPIVAQNRILVTPWFVSADFIEIPDMNSTDETDDERIAIMNSNIERNAELTAIEKEYCIGK